jgi:hypothetical protein
MCIVYLTSVFGSFFTSTAKHGYKWEGVDG